MDSSACTCFPLKILHIAIDIVVYFSVWSVADPRFVQAGPNSGRPNFADVVEWSCASEVSIKMKTQALPFLAIGLSLWISCEIMRHGLPTALHESEELFLNYLILRFSGGFHMKSIGLQQDELLHDRQVYVFQ